MAFVTPSGVGVRNRDLERHSVPYHINPLPGTRHTTKNATSMSVFCTTSVQSSTLPHRVWELGTSVIMPPTASELPNNSHPRIVVGSVSLSGAQGSDRRRDTADAVVMLHRTRATPEARRFVAHMVGEENVRFFITSRIKGDGELDILTPTLTIGHSGMGRALADSDDKSATLPNVPTVQLGDPDFTIAPALLNPKPFIALVKRGLASATRLAGTGALVSGRILRAQPSRLGVQKNRPQKKHASHLVPL